MSARIVIAGGGFGGLQVARLLSRVLRPGEAEVVLVDRTGYHTLRPKIPQSIGGRIPCTVRLPLARLLDGTGVQLVVQEITRIDPTARRVEWNGGSVAGDALVLALGGESHVPPQLAAQTDAALAVWSFDQACALRRRLEWLAAAARKGKPVDMTVAVVGGGFVGVEVAAEIQERLVRLGGPAWQGQVTLFEREPRILPRLSPWASRVAAQHLGRVGVHVVTGAGIRTIRPGGLELVGGETVRAGTIVWAGGAVRAPQVLVEAGLTDAAGRIPVSRTLELEGFPGVFAVGDNARVVTGEHAADEPSAHRAERQAAVAARNLVARLRSEAMVPDRPARNIYIVGLGARYGVLDAGPGLRLTGLAAAVLKEITIAAYLWRCGGWPLARRALGPVVLDGLSRRRWERQPAPDGQSFQDRLVRVPPS